MSSLTVIRAGMLTTVQDLGRWGYQSGGVPVAGPMDSYCTGWPTGLPVPIATRLRWRSRSSPRSSMPTKTD